MRVASALWILFTDIDPHVALPGDWQFGRFPVSRSSHDHRDQIMQRVAIHPGVAVVSDLDAFNGIFVQRRTNLTDIAG